MPTISPSNTPEKRTVEADRIPMSLPVLKLAVPELPGYHLHWINGDPARIAQAMRAGYQFVDGEEVDLNNFGLADSASKSGNSDMGSRVSVISGTNDQGGTNHLYLMKIPEKWWQEDQASLEARNEQVAAALRGGDANPGPGGDGTNRYIPDSGRKAVETIFTPKRRA